MPDRMLISISEAAARLTGDGDAVSRSALSRYLTQHAEAGLFEDVGSRRLVDLDRLREHRAENIRVNGRVQPQTPRDDVAAMPVQPQSVPAERAALSGSARKAMADAEIRELDLAERRGELTPTAEVERAGRDSVALMLSAFERAVEPEAAHLAVAYGWDERKARLALKAFVRRGIDEFHRSMLDRLDRRSRGEAASLDPADLPAAREAVLQ